MSATEATDTSRWARLTWQAGDPAAWAKTLGLRLGLTPRRLDGGAWRFDLGGELLDIVAWQREGPKDELSAEGRLVLEPISGGGAAPSPRPDAALTLAAVAWSTVELDRAEADLDPWLRPADATASDGDAPADPHLGANARRRRTAALPGGTIVFAEPNTEGRLAASLARDGEGPCALYLIAAGGLAAWTADARARHVQVSAKRPGPLGLAVLVAGRTVAGPHILVVEPLGASTIAP
ncbi:MAG: hypothetical protein U0838_15205 [Chloroflexota bacterium]